MVATEGQCPFKRALPEIMWKTMALKPNSLETSKSIQKTLLGSWYTKVKGLIKASWILKKNASCWKVGGPSFVLDA